MSYVSTDVLRFLVNSCALLPDFPVHRCEAGDLAGKFGPLMPHVDLDVTDSTGQLTLSGPLSIIGRSVVVHSSVDGSNFECGTIQLVEQTDATGRYIKSILF